MPTVVYYGAGNNAVNNLRRFIETCGEPVCFSDRDTNKHYTRFSPAEYVKEGYDILPLDVVVGKFPDYELYITLGYENWGCVTRYLIKQGIPLGRIKYCENFEPSQLKRYLESHCSLCWAPHGHFYSPIPNIKEMIDNNHNIIKDYDSVLGINLNKNEQLELLCDFSKFQNEQPFANTKTDGIRYYFNNSNFSTYMDALTLYCFLRKFAPKRIIEVGSGFSSCLMLDVNQLFLNNKINLTFIEPYPQRLLENVSLEDNYRLIQRKVQDVDIDIFKTLERGDILFIDSTHVSKTGSDVNHLYFDVIPKLAEGVIIHIHDIFFPFEYPLSWIFEGRAWNELYLLRAMLTGSNMLKIKFFNSYLQKKFPGEIEKNMPLVSTQKNKAGGSIWLEKMRYPE